MELLWRRATSRRAWPTCSSEQASTVGSLYHYFPGKQDVLIAVLELYSTASTRCCRRLRGRTFPIRSTRSSRCSRNIARPSQGARRMEGSVAHPDAEAEV